MEESRLATKQPTKTYRAESTRRPRSSRVVVTNRFDGVHPGVLAIADDLANGDRRRIRIISPTHLEVD